MSETRYTPEQMREWADSPNSSHSIAAMLHQAATDAEALATLRQLVVDLQQHSREAGWQDVDDPIAALLALGLTGDATEGQG